MLGKRNGRSRSLLGMLLAFTVLLSSGGSLAGAQDVAPRLIPDKIISIPMSDGVKIAAAVYLPPNAHGKYPVLLAASAYRFDNDAVPAMAIYPFMELGPVRYYTQHGYVYVHMDVRGSGRSGGTYTYQSRREQRDLYEAIEWIAKQPWSTGKIGGVGQSYYARAQWFMGTQHPPHLSCIAPYDGNIDTYHSSAYTGGIPGDYPDSWFDGLRSQNLYPRTGPPRVIAYDYTLQALRHNLYDDFWKERTVAEQLPTVKVPTFSIGVWGKVDLHLNGNIVGFQRVSGPKKLLVFGGANVEQAVADYSSIGFHETYLRPFYDWCLKGEQTSYVNAPAVRYALTGTDKILSADSWPPAGTNYETLFLNNGPTGSVVSLNDGALNAAAPDASSAPTVFTYPNAGWTNGVVGRGPDGRPDPARRVLTFTTAPLDADTQVVGPIELILYASSSNADTDFFVKLSDQSPNTDADQKAGLNPRYSIVTKGWLRASHRALDPKWSLPHAPWYTDAKEQPLHSGQVYKFDIAVMPTAHLFKKGSRIRLELANGDSATTDAPFTHRYSPRKLGADTIYHDAQHPSELLLPLLPGAPAAAAQ
jgi:putative CocE/NonD family hydrolase